MTAWVSPATMKPLTVDNGCAYNYEGEVYPAPGGIPRLRPGDESGDTSTSQGRFVTDAESDFYTDISRHALTDIKSSDAYRFLKQRATSITLANVAEWADTVADYSAQVAAYEHLASLENGTIVQVGGTGGHAAVFSLAGFTTVLVAPLDAEAEFAKELARSLGIDDRMTVCVGYGETLPLADASADGVFLGGSLHHIDCAPFGGQLSRVLRPQERFAAMEPFRVPVLHELGTGLLGKRERSVDCRPMDHERIAKLQSGFEGGISYRRYSPIIRYAALAAQKFGMPIHHWRPLLARVSWLSAGR